MGLLERLAMGGDGAASCSPCCWRTPEGHLVVGVTVSRSGLGAPPCVLASWFQDWDSLAGSQDSFPYFYPKSWGPGFLQELY